MTHQTLQEDLIVSIDADTLIRYGRDKQPIDFDEKRLQHYCDQIATIRHGREHEDAAGEKVLSTRYATTIVLGGAAEVGQALQHQRERVYRTLTDEIDREILSGIGRGRLEHILATNFAWRDLGMAAIEIDAERLEEDAYSKKLIAMIERSHANWIIPVLLGFDEKVCSPKLLAERIAAFSATRTHIAHLITGEGDVADANDIRHIYAYQNGRLLQAYAPTI